MLVDTHAHLYAKQFDEDRQLMLDRAVSVGIEKIFLPNIDTQSIAGMYELVELRPDLCYPMMGLHPCSVKENYEQELDTIEAHLRSGNQDGERRFCAVGECGLDYHWDLTFKSQQIKALRRQIEWAKDLDLPIVLHCRESMDDVIREIQKAQDGSLKGIFHCFSGTQKHVEQVIELGFLMGLGGVLTFKKSGVDELVKNVALKHLVLETDAPYLAPTPYRGKRNETAYMVKVAERLAEVKGITVAEVAEATTKNALDLFRIDVV